MRSTRVIQVLIAHCSIEKDYDVTIPTMCVSPTVQHRVTFRDPATHSTGRSQQAGQPKMGFGTIDDHGSDERVQSQSWELSPVSKRHEAIIGC